MYYLNNKFNNAEYIKFRIIFQRLTKIHIQINNLYQI